MYNYDVAFLSRVIPQELKERISAKRKNTMSASGENLQWKLVHGLDGALDKPVRLFNFMPIQSFPKYYDEIYVKGGKFSHTEGAEDVNLPFFNLMYLKRFFMGNSLYREIKKWAKEDDGREKLLISYSLTPEFARAAVLAKRVNPEIKVCAVVADLPEYTVLTKKIDFTTKIYLSWMRRKTNEQLDKIDFFVLLTEQMSEKLVTHQRYIVMEGIGSETVIKPQRDGRKKQIFYAGTLNERFGVMHLVNAFMGIPDDDASLVLCGLGDARDKIIAEAKKDKRICFMGQLGGDEIFELMSRSAVIVNPRHGDEEFTKYSFPSKNLEALSSGIPFVAYKLAGIPDEYDAYINYPKDESTESLAELLTEICNSRDEEYVTRAQQAREWVEKEKNSAVQAERILEMINGEK